MLPGWKEKLAQSLLEDSLLLSEAEIMKYSTDFSHLSPVLKRLLHGKTADCIARPADMDELETVFSIAYKYRVPLTPRGFGTSNYGQSVPLAGGIIVDFTRLNAILEIGDGYMRTQAGANMLAMEKAARECGQELTLLPTTYKKSTIAGFLLGGFGGIGSVQYGSIWDGMVKLMEIKTMEQPSRLYTVTGDDIQPFLHSYGVLGFVTEVTVELVPKRNWTQYAVSFADWETAGRFGMATASDAGLNKRLVSVNEWPIPRYFTTLPLARDKAVAFVIAESEQEERFEGIVREWGGTIDYVIPPEKLHVGAGLPEFSFGHYRLWVQNAEPAYTNIQIVLDNDCFIEQMRELKADFPDLLVHFEFVRRRGALETHGTPIFKYGTEERIAFLKKRVHEIGGTVEDPHTYDLEGGGRSYAIDKMWEIKNANDPLGLLNPHKLAPLAKGTA